MIPAWDGPVAVGAQTPPLGGGPVVTVAELASALDALAAQQQRQQQQQQNTQDSDPFPDFLNDYGKSPAAAASRFILLEGKRISRLCLSYNTAPSCGSAGGVSCHAPSSSSTSNNDLNGLNLATLERRTSEGPDASAFPRLCMVASTTSDVQDNWETATIVEDMLTEGIPQLEFEDSDVSTSGSYVAAAPIAADAVMMSSSIPTSSLQSRSVFVAWQDASDDFMRNVRLFLGPLAQSQELWSSWGLRTEDWPAFNLAVNQHPEETDAHVSTLVQAVQSAIQADQVSSPALHIHENQDIVIVVRSIQLRPSAVSLLDTIFSVSARALDLPYLLSSLFHTQHSHWNYLLMVIPSLWSPWSNLVFAHLQTFGHRLS